MKQSEGKGNFILGIVFLALGLILDFLIIPSQIKYIDGGYPQPRFFPYVICSLMAVLGFALAVNGFRKMKSGKDVQKDYYSFKWHEVRLVLLTLGIMAAYVASMEKVPYLPATVITTGVLVTLFGQRKIWKILLTAILVPIIIYVGMVYGLKVRMP